MTSMSSSAARRSTGCPLFPEFARSEEEWWPARFVLRNVAGRQIDFHPVDFDEHGDGWQELIDGCRGRYPGADLEGSGRIGRRAVRCISPELQLRYHDYPTGRPDDIDWDDVRILCERFGLGLPGLPQASGLHRIEADGRCRDREPHRRLLRRSLVDMPSHVG
jgi:hypothetical protein